ncbi:unnamed protein product [Callosobruchus maculatus]|uniref:Peptidase S1 domain-containing protein n=1 Tax=Callosobruchus maculatus TaxID=64391 RepID=A0A653DG92_CALMS|nr:unnamed protein product [Callosobruchus maculatus]
MVLLLDIIFLTVAVVVIATGAMMALLVNLILPGHYWDQSRSGYVPFPVLKVNSWETIDIHWMDVERTVGDIREYPFLVSISSYPYLDAKKHCLFLCSGAIVYVEGEVMILTGSGCNLENHNNVVVRGTSDFFWRDGKVSKISSTEHIGGWVLLKLDQNVGKPASMNITDKIPVNSMFYGLGWGAEVRPNVDIYSNEKFYVETWGTSYEDICKNTKNYCNHFFYTHQISKFFIDAMDDKLTCCYEAFITHTNRRNIRNIHGENIGKPLVYIDTDGKPSIIAMQYQIGFRASDTIGYYTVFNAVAPHLSSHDEEEEEEEGFEEEEKETTKNNEAAEGKEVKEEEKEEKGAGGEKEGEVKEDEKDEDEPPNKEEDEPIVNKPATQEMRRPKGNKRKGGKTSNKASAKVKRALDEQIGGARLIATRIYKVQNVKKFFLQWFRYSGTRDGEQYANYDPELWNLEKKPDVNATVICYEMTNEGKHLKQDYEITITERPFLP